MAVVALALLLSAACERAASPAAPDGVDFSAIADASQRWQAYGLKDYVVEQKRSCYCALPRGFVRLTVRDNKIIGGVDVTTTQPVPPQALQSYKTVDEMFAWLRDVKAHNPARLAIDYDARFGYPERIVWITPWASLMTICRLSSNRWNVSFQWSEHGLRFVRGTLGLIRHPHAGGDSTRQASSGESHSDTGYRFSASSSRNKSVRTARTWLEAFRLSTSCDPIEG